MSEDDSERDEAYRRLSEPRPQILLMSGAEWERFSAACERIGREPSSDLYWAWRMRDPLFPLFESRP